MFTEYTYLYCAARLFPWYMAKRLDMVPLRSNVERTPQGGIRVAATLTRAGIFEYRNADGSTRKEYRPEAEVFSPKSLASMRGAVVTEDHPTVAVRTDNWKQYAIGYLDGPPRRDGLHVDGDIVVMDPGAVGRVDSRALAEVSMGYDCNFDGKPGTCEHGEYDGTQTDIVYNHVSLGPKGWARGGSEVRLHTDGGTDLAYASFPATMADPIAPATTPVVPVAEFEKVRGERDAAQARADAAETATKNEKTRANALAANVQAFERTAVLAQVAALLPKDYQSEGKSTREIRVDAIKGRVPAFDDKGRSDEYVTAYLDALPAQAPVAAPHSPLSVFRPAARTDGVAPVTREDGAADPIADRLSKRAAKQVARFDSYQPALSRFNPSVTRFNQASK